jgi:hypothetical protein
MWRPLLSGLFCVPAAILLFIGFFGNPAVRRSDLRVDPVVGLPPVRQAAAITISLHPPAQPTTASKPEPGAGQVVLADASGQPLPWEPGADLPPAEATDARSQPAHRAPVRSMRAFRRKDIALLLGPSLPNEPAHRPPPAWVPPPSSGS